MTFAYLPQLASSLTKQTQLRLHRPSQVCGTGPLSCTWPFAPTRQMQMCNTSCTWKLTVETMVPQRPLLPPTVRTTRHRTTTCAQTLHPSTWTHSPSAASSAPRTQATGSSSPSPATQHTSRWAWMCSLHTATATLTPFSLAIRDFSPVPLQPQTTSTWVELR